MAWNSIYRKPYLLLLNVFFKKYRFYSVLIEIGLEKDIHLIKSTYWKFKLFLLRNYLGNVIFKY